MIGWKGTEPLRASFWGDKQGINSQLNKIGFKEQTIFSQTFLSSENFLHFFIKTVWWLNPQSKAGWAKKYQTGREEKALSMFCL